MEQYIYKCRNRINFKRTATEPYGVTFYRLLISLFLRPSAILSGYSDPGVIPEHQNEKGKWRPQIRARKDIYSSISLRVFAQYALFSTGFCSMSVECKLVFDTVPWELHKELLRVESSCVNITTRQSLWSPCYQELKMLRQRYKERENMWLKLATTKGGSN